MKTKQTPIRVDRSKLRELRKKEKAERRLLLAQEQELARTGLVARQHAAVQALNGERVQALLEDAREESERLAPMKSYDELRALYERTLAAAGVDMRDLMLRFSWDPESRSLVVDVAPTLAAAQAAREKVCAERPGLLLPLDLATMEAPRKGLPQ